MGLFSWLPKWGRKSSPDGTLDLFRQIYGYPESKSGQVVNWRTAVQVSAVLACVRVLANGISQVPLKINRARKDGGADLATDEPLYNLLAKAPNALQTAFEYFQQIGWHLFLVGNHFTWINRVRGRIYELLPLEPAWVQVRRNNDWTLTYIVTMPGKAAVEMTSKEIWHIRMPSWCGWMGLEPVKLAREAIGLSMSSEEHVARTMSQGGNISGVLSAEQGVNLTPDQIKELRDSWMDLYTGAANAGKTAILNNMKFQPISMTLVDAQMAEQRKFQIEEIARSFGVFPQMIGYSDKTSTYASAEAFFSAHVVHTLQPIYRMIEQSIDKNLLGIESGVYSKFNANALLRGLAKDRGAFYKALYELGSINPNEIRAFEDMNPYVGGEKFRVPLNMEDPTDPDPKPDTDDPDAEDPSAPKE